MREIDYYNLGHKRETSNQDLRARIKELEKENQALRDRIEYLECIQNWRYGKYPAPLCVSDEEEG